ncbi:Bromodomain-containing protein [Phlyctochytrium arcticum]|nr:Bromodomain-containing protein [Phlyctochytrium arcticum]
MKTTSSVESDHYDVAFPDKRHEENLFEQNSRVDNPQVPAVPGRDAQMNGTATFANDFLPTSPPQEKTSSNDPLLQEQLKFCGNVLKSIKRLKDAKPFLQPVDPIALNIPTYLDVIKHPMDISTMERKLKQNEYSSIEHFKNDMQLILDNCVTFNGPDSAVSQSGKSVIRSFKKYMEKLPQNVKFDKSRKKSLAMDSPSDQFGEGGRPKRDIHPPVKEISRTASPTPLKAGTPKSKNADKDLKFCAEVLRELYKKQHAAYNFPFLLPVDPIALGIPHYHDVIKFPMDLSTVKKKLENQAYHSTEEFEADVRLMFNNCYTFNPPGTDVYNYGKKLEEVFDRKLREKPQFQAHTPVPIRTPRPSKANIKPQFNDASSSSDPDDDDDDTDTKQLILLQQQLQAITTQMAWLQEKRAKKKQKKRSLGNLAKVDASSTKPPRIPKSKVKSSTSGTRKQKSTKKKTSDQYKARRRVEYSSDEGESADKLPELTYDQKAELVNLVNELTHDNVEKVMDIIRSGSGFPDVSVIPGRRFWRDF